MPAALIQLPPTLVELAVAKNDVRYYLNWPYLDLSDKKRPMLVATNGHMLVAAPVDITGEVAQGPLPLEALQRAREDNNGVLVVEGDFVGTPDALFRRPPNDFKYPDWRNVLKHAPDGDHDISFDGEYLDRLQRSLSDSSWPGIKIRCSRKPDGSIDGDKVARVRPLNPRPNSKDVIALLMPRRVD